MIQNITLVLCLESINMWIDMDNKIIEKIQNLLELAYDAPNDEEGQTALLMAQRLMVKHNLSMNVLTNSKTQKDIGETIGTQEQVQSSEEFGLMVKIPAEVLEEQRLGMGKLERRSLKIEIEVDYEAYIAGLEHAKETMLLSEELLQV